MKSGWCYGKCERTNAKGDFPAECVCPTKHHQATPSYSGELGYFVNLMLNEGIE